MELDPEQLKQLLATFKVELEERLQLITDGLLALEKKECTNEDSIKIIEAIFRAAHNVKGAARGVGAHDVGEIAHHIENLFAAIQKNTLEISPAIIDRCLEAIDKMYLAAQAFIEKKPLSFDMQDFLSHFENADLLRAAPVKIEEKEKSEQISDPKVKGNSKVKLETNEHETVRVSLNNLERISALLEEMQVTNIAMNDHYAEVAKLAAKTNQFSDVWKQTLRSIKKRFGNEMGEHFYKMYHSNTDSVTEIAAITGTLHKDLHARVNELSILSHALQEEVRLLRLIPAANLLRTLPRSVRDIAHELKKPVDIVITGDEVKMDKMVLEALQNPIIHLLRNAIDHGIESADLRKAAGKPENGRIILEVKEEGNQILIVVSDDGAGIDVKKIAGIAENKNIISKAELENLNQDEILMLLFRPGFSTKDVITDVSGRGVGLDVVKANITDLKGQVSVSTIVGKGTTFYLRVPLTLASSRGLMVNSGGQTFVIPTHAIERVLAISVKDIVEVEAHQVILLEKHPVSLHNLSDILQLERREPALPEQLSVVIIKIAEHRVALLVDEILGEREVVIKPLQAPLSDVRFVAGGTLSSSGQIMIVLNPDDLINSTLYAGETTRTSFRSEQAKVKSLPRILVVDDSITTRTLEKSILENKGYQVSLAVDGKEAWELLQRQTFELLITDINMPNMDGFMLTERVKQSDKLRELPVIMVTSLDSATEKKRGIDVGADAYIVKSEFESDALLEIVAQLV